VSIPVREFLWIVVESSYGTPKTTPVAGTDSIYVRLDEGNAFTAENVPLTVDIRYGGGLATKCDTVSDKQEIKGNLKVKLCYSQAAILLGLALIRVNAGKTAPWAQTTEPPGDIASVTVYHAVWADDLGDYVRKKLSGGKCLKGKVEVSEESQVLTLNLDLQFSKYDGNPFDSSSDPDATAFPAPTDASYPTDYVTFSHSDGGLFLGSLVTARAQYWNLALDWDNKVEVAFFAKRWIQRMRSFGRDVGLDAEILLVSSPDDRTTFSQLGSLAAKLIFTNGVNTLTFDYKTASRIKTLPFDLPLDKMYRRKLSLENRWDKSASVDFALGIV
jgi:hypothetical protein